MISWGFLDLEDFVGFGFFVLDFLMVFYGLDMFFFGGEDVQYFHADFMG